MNTSDLKSFHYLENGQIQFSLFDTIKSSKTLDSGFYNLVYDDNRNQVTVELSVSPEKTKIHEFPDKEKLDEFFLAFYNKSVYSKIKSLGFCHKAGILLYGKEGTGKSTILKHYASAAFKKENAIVFYMTRSYFAACWDFVRQIRAIQENPIVIIMEEFDQFVNSNGMEATVKTIMDGNLSIDNCVFLSATNYIESIPAALKNRASRFKHVLDIEGIQNVEDVISILSPMIHGLFTPEEIQVFANDLKGSTIDAIKQFALDKLMDLKTYKKEKNTIGFKIG